MVCYGVIDPPEPPYILIFMASLQGIAFNVFWVSGDNDYSDERTNNPTQSLNFASSRPELPI